MNADDKKHSQDWLNRRLSPICPSCQQRHAFNVLDQFVTPILMSENNVLDLGGQSMPLIGVACTNCSHIRFFSAIMMGITPKPALSDETSESSTPK